MTAALAAEMGTREPAARLLPFRPAVVRLGGWLAAGAAAAASILLLLLRSPAILTPLPSYTADMKGYTSADRGDAAKPERYVYPEGSQLTFCARPATAVRDPVDARFCFSRSSELVTCQPPPGLELMPKGKVCLHGRIGTDIRLTPGDYTVFLVVGRPRAVPRDEELGPAVLARMRAERLGRRAPPAPWDAVSVPLRVQGRSPE
jgi:hypothetical protein